MTIRKAYSNLILPGRVHKSLILKIIFPFFILFCIPANLSGQDEPEYYEIAVFLDIPRTGGGEIDAVIKGQEIYLPITDLFNFLKIRNIPSPDLESVSGFFINPEATYTISKTENKITYQDKTYDLQDGDLIRTESNLYLKSSYYGKVFGLDCNFNFRSLSVTVVSKLELPYIREMRQEEMRRNLTRLKGEVIADTTIGRTHPLFQFGMADWSVMAQEEINGKSQTRLNLSLGSMIAGGEATASLNYSNTDPFSEKQQYYLWRYVNNDFKPMRQVMAGKINSNAVSTIYNPVIGIQFTNTPTTYRRSFGSYTLSDKTEPGWIVELYVNNVLIDYVKADASGFFTFEVPLVYGNTIVTLKFFGPWGEERVREQNINIPFNFLPKNTFEYNVSAGIVEDTLSSRFSKVSLNYGLTRGLTIGGGVEYLSSVTSTPAMPYMNASLKITNNLLVTGQYNYGVRTKGTMTYRLPSNLQFDLNYTWYNKNQKAINYNYREERKAIVSMPLHIGKFSSYQRLTVYQIILPSSQYTTGEWMFSGTPFGIGTNLSTYGIFINSLAPVFYSNLSLSLRMPAGFIMRPSAQYGYTQKEFLTAKLSLEKHIKQHAYLNMSYEQNFRNDLMLAELGFRYDFSFAQTGFSVRQSDKRTSFIQYARGSLISDTKTRYIRADNRTNVGRGGIIIKPFLDINFNGKRDAGEPAAYGLNIHTNGGRVEKDDRDTTIKILSLEPYTSCFIELDPNSFENISWRLLKQSMSVSVDPDILKLVEVPVAVVGEADGRITLDKNGEINGIGRIIVEFYTAGRKLAGKTLSEGDGYFSYFGLAPGKYFVRPEKAQMEKLRMVNEPDSIEFTISQGIDGDIVEDLNFTLRVIPGIDTTGTKPEERPQLPVVKKDTSYIVVHEVTEELVTISEDSYAIQMGAFRNKAYGEAYRQKIQNILGSDNKVEIVVEDNFYKIRVSEIKDRQTVDKYIDTLKLNGVTEVWVISLKAKRQQLVLREKQDTIIKTTETVTLNPAVIAMPDISIQLGAFALESNAIALRDRLASSLGRKIIIVHEGGLYKVRISGIPMTDHSVLDALQRAEPSVGKLGLKDVWVLPFKVPPAEEPAVRQVEPPLNPVEWNRNVPEVMKSLELPGLIAEKNLYPAISSVPPGGVEQPAKAEPKVGLQVGIFYKKSEAMRAQRRITSKLGLQVEVVPQWDYYRVIVKGFYTREETFKYYPELAGLGYPNIIPIEIK